MDPEYIQKVQEWVKLDNKVMEVQNKIKPLQESIKELQEDNKKLFEEKERVEKDITEYIEKQKMEMLTINTSDGNIKFARRSSTQVLSLKVLKNILVQFVPDTATTNEDIYNYIVENLDKKNKLSIKRTLK